MRQKQEAIPQACKQHSDCTVDAAMWAVLLEPDISSLKEEQKMPLKSLFRLLVGFGNTPGTHSELCALINLQPTAQSAGNKCDSLFFVLFFYGHIPRWICELNPNNLGNCPSGEYLQIPPSNNCVVFFRPRNHFFLHLELFVDSLEPLSHKRASWFRLAWPSAEPRTERYTPADGRYLLPTAYLRVWDPQLSAVMFP